jgi:hypothetical protein
MRRLGFVVVPALVAFAGMIAVARTAGIDSAWFAFVVVWAPMAGLGTASRLVRPQLPEYWYRLRSWERSGRVYERAGVRIVKRLLRRGPLSWFNPDLHLPGERTPEAVVHLERRMRDAEASHAILAAATVVVAASLAVMGWWSTAVATLVFDVLMNGYPVALQRYNRAFLARRHPDVLGASGITPPAPVNPHRRPEAEAPRPGRR